MSFEYRNAPDTLNTMPAPLEPYQDAITKLCARYNVKHLAVFGSAARQRDFDLKTSDIDLLVTFGPSDNKAETYFGLLESLEQLLQRNIDLVEESAVRNPYVLKAIQEHQRTLYAAPVSSKMMQAEAPTLERRDKNVKLFGGVWV